MKTLKRDKTGLYKTLFLSLIIMPFDKFSFAKIKKKTFIGTDLNLWEWVGGGFGIEGEN